MLSSTCFLEHTQLCRVPQQIWYFPGGWPLSCYAEKSRYHILKLKSLSSQEDEPWAAMLVPLLVALCHCGFSQHQRRTKYHRHVVLTPRITVISPSTTGNPMLFSFLPTILGSTMCPGTIQLCRFILWKKHVSSWMLWKKLLTLWKGIQDKSLQAPTMASLAKQGVVLEQNYVQPKCAPSRAALMTGDPWHPSLSYHCL